MVAVNAGSVRLPARMRILFLAKANYRFEKRQRELLKKQKQEAKRQKKPARDPAPPGGESTGSSPGSPPSQDVREND
jgi:hypothetical protein